MLQRKSNHNDLLFTLLLTFYVIWKTATYVALYTNTIIAMFVLLFIAYLFLARDMRFFNSAPTMLAAANIYMLLMLYDKYQSESNLLYMVWAVYLEYFPILLGSLLLFYRMDKQVRALVPVLIGVYVVTCITTYIGLLDYPMASRELATGSVDYTPYYARNIGGFNFIYSLIVLHPMFVCVLRKYKRSLLAVVISVLVGMCIVESKYTTAALTFAISCVAYIVPIDSNKKNKSRIWLLLALLVIGYRIAPDVLRWMAQQKIFEASSEKLMDIALMLEGEEASIESTMNREKAYEKSWQAFLNYPVFGNVIMGSHANGGHSFILDTMAKWGLIGLSAIVFIIRRLFKFYKEISSDYNVFIFSMLSLTLAVLLSGLNSRLWVFELGFAVPILIQYTGYARIKEQQTQHDTQ